MSIRVRLAEADDFEVLELIENQADVLLIDYLHAATWWPSTPTAERHTVPGFTLVATDVTTERPVGFALVLQDEGTAHLEQLSVLPEFTRRGYGRQLVRGAAEESRKRGHTQLTLRTFADVPWNAPFYGTCGFVLTAPETKFHRKLVAAEDELGLPKYGRRVQMTLNL